jgi:ribosomal-protein-serine acetyltransferase
MVALSDTLAHMRLDQRPAIQAIPVRGAHHRYDFGAMMVGDPRFTARELAVTEGMTLLVRPIEPSDTGAWVAHVRGDLEHLGEFLGWPAATCDPTAARGFITRYAEQQSGRKLLLGAFDGPRLMGGTVLMSHEPLRATVELGCWIVAALEGQGVVRRLCLETLRYAREDLLVHRVEWRTASENTRSRDLATRLGFSFEGRQREAAVHDGHRQDLDLFSLVGSEIDERLASRPGDTTAPVDEAHCR